MAPEVIGPDLPALRLMLADVRGTVAVQMESGAQIDQKAARIVAWNGVLLGLILTAASIAASTGRPPWPSLALGTAGFLALIGSMVHAIRAYAATEYRPGLEPADLARALAYRIDERFQLAGAVEAYARAHVANQAALDHVIVALRRALLAHVVALGLFALSSGCFIWLKGGI